MAAGLVLQFAVSMGQAIGVGMVDETRGDAVTGLAPSVSTRFFRTVVILMPVGVLAWAAIGLGFYRLVA